MVALDRRSVLAARFDDVGIQGALDQELGVCDPARRSLEDTYEQLADDLAFCLGLGDAGQLLEEVV